MTATKPRCTRCGDTGVTRSVGVDMGGELDPPSRCPHCPKRMTDGDVARLLLSQAPSTEQARGKAERDRLLARVRAASERYTIPGGYKSLAADLGISEDEAAALCQDVWPS